MCYMKRRYWAICILLVAGGVIYSSTHTEASPQRAQGNVLCNSYNGFGFDLYSREVEQGKGKNTIVSPASVSLALAMTQNGAEGETYQAISGVLHLEEMRRIEFNETNRKLLLELEEMDEGVTLSIANSIWLHRQLAFDQIFIEQNKNNFRAEFFPLTTADKINQWVETNTQGKIDKIIDNLRDDEIAVLINAIYFRGTWTREFDPGQTAEETFHLSGGASRTVPMMRRSGEFDYYEEGFQAVRLPYGSGRMALYIFLPEKESGLEEFHRKLNLPNWNGWIQGFRSRRGFISLPRIKAEYQSNLSPSLIDLGMGIAFGNRADFSRLVKNAAAPVCISKVMHKTYIEVNEEGTEAAAATSVQIILTSARPETKPFSMIVDRPFFLAIQDSQTGIILFLGGIQSP
ncbi:MAG: serpin family protein [Candidatus Krumholzibacteriota bacterium]|nr:serpin family protein [Candidatus Krumholzibacteriota bacterium]